MSKQDDEEYTKVEVNMGHIDDTDHLERRNKLQKEFEKLKKELEKDG